MKFQWNKQGLIFNPTGRFDWMDGYAQVPTVLQLHDKLRIFFTCRPKRSNDGTMVSFVSYIDVAKNDPSDIIYIHDSPILQLGGIGSFDEFGIHPGSFMLMDDKVWFFYQGWTREVSVPYQTCLGLAFSDDYGENFYRFSNGPILSRNIFDPFLTNGFFVYPNEEELILFYGSCSEWINIDNKINEPVYHIKKAHSKDGVIWTTNDRLLLTKQHEKESAGRPCVVKIDNVYHMWFCYRDVYSFRGSNSGAYNIGYAYSTDLENWVRDDNLSGINKSVHGWDSEMIAYPFIEHVDDKYYMFYNGNEFGKNGFGYATLEMIQQ